VTAAAAPPPPHGHAIDRATVRQKKTGQPVRFEMTEQTREAVDAALRRSELQSPESDQIIAAQRVTIEQQDATIRDLRTGLDREADERRHLIALLTDRRS
jgi:hypothetical protein